MWLVTITNFCFFSAIFSCLILINSAMFSGKKLGLTVLMMLNKNSLLRTYLSLKSGRYLRMIGS